MAKYANLDDATDPALTVEERHLRKADVYLDAELFKRGFNPADLLLPIPVLTEIAALMALQLACIEQPLSENAQLKEKCLEYERLSKMLLESVTFDGLGITGGAKNVTVTLV